MNTPAHLAASLLVWRNQSGWSAATAVGLGAVLPDLPMYGFYGYQKLAGRSERDIWSKLYFDEDWQLLFDTFNSIPLFLLVVALGYAVGFRWGLLLGASAVLHLCCDFPLHHDDAHRHFLPLSNWRFASPVSYWDPQHYGLIVVWIELGFAVAACIYVACTSQSNPFRALAVATCSLYLVGLVVALLIWLPQL